MDRREFARITGIGTLVVVSEGLGGCARVLRWSESRHEQVVARDVDDAPQDAAPANSSTASGSAEATGTSSQTWPDLAVTKGDDPGKNTAAAIALLGGMKQFVKPGQTVVVKPNILTTREPKYGVTTNPAAVATVVRLAWEAGAKSVTVLDRPDRRRATGLHGVRDLEGRRRGRRAHEGTVGAGLRARQYPGRSSTPRLADGR